MKAIIISKTDKASCNIFENLLTIKDWTREGELQGDPLYFSEDFCIKTINDEHIFHDNVDVELSKVIKEKLECIIYASRHRSESGTRSLTVHPIGNFARAEFGGKDKTLVPSSPHLMTQALRILRKKAKGLDYSISFEATHHGPFLQTPTFFIEIGSEKKAWEDKEAGRVIAETILAIHAPDYPIGIGVGGGHYAPRITDVAIERKISFGHIIPTYVLAHLTTGMVKKVLKATASAEKVYLHKKHLKGEQYKRWKEVFIGKGITPVRSSDLEILGR
jgi:D-aminoacyl-tRNA deacylase